MSLKCIKSILVASLVIVSSACRGQFNSYKKQKPLLIHLEKEHLFNERIFLLSHLQDSSFSNAVNLEKAWTYHALGNLESARSSYNLVSTDSIAHYNFDSDYVSLLYKENETLKIRDFLRSSSMKGKPITESFERGLSLLDMNFSAGEINSMELPEKLKEAYRKNLKIQKKSVVLTGLYSMAIPGLGKAYYGKKIEALNAFAANLLFGIQAYESYTKAGAGSARFIFFGTAFSVFYLSNIYGSIAGLIKSKKDWKKQLHYEVGYSHFNTGAAVQPAYK